jgi:hypothetical protein
MKMNKPIMTIINGLFTGIIFFVTTFCYANTENLKSKIAEVMYIDKLVEEIDSEIQKTIVSEINKITNSNLEIYYDKKIKDKILNLDNFVKSMKSKIEDQMGVLKPQEDFGSKIYETIISSADFLIHWMQIMNDEQRDDDGWYQSGFRFSHFNGYSLAYSIFKQSITLFFQCYQNQVNFQRTSELICENHDLIDKVDYKVDKLLAYHDKNRLGLTFNYFSGRKGDNSFRYVGMFYRFQLSACNQQIQFIPELGIDIDGNNHGLVGLSISYDFTKIISVFGGTVTVFPKHDHAKTGWQVGVYKEFIHRISVGLKYCSHFSLGLHLILLL